MDEQNRIYQDETPSLVRSALLKLEVGDLEPSPFMKTRLLAQFKEREQKRKSVFIWKLVSGFSVTACAVLAITLINQPSTDSKAMADNPYVIHMDFNSGDLKSVTSAEIYLPEKVHFVSGGSQDLKDRKILRLPLKVGQAGRTRLPFVVSSSEIGMQILRVRLYDDNGDLLKEKDLKIRFAKNQGPTTL